MILERRALERHVRTFLDVIVLAILNSEPTYGYRIIGAIHREFGTLLSPGLLYPLLRELETQKLIQPSRVRGRGLGELISDLARLAEEAQEYKKD